MSYQVLSLKLRPQNFHEVVGQTHVTRTLQNAIKINRVVHGYIFSGPRGVGKTTTARILSKVLNCNDVKDNNPCGTCNNCFEITSGSSLDVQELDGASNRGIDEIRDLRESIKYPPHKGKYRIFIIDEVHMFTREAFNALLKTLEEPPDHVIFIMATTDSYRIPPTILSRTQQFDFKPISKNNISNYLVKILEEEKISFDMEGIHLISQKANGSLRDALSLLEQVITYANNKLELNLIRDVLGIIKEDVFFNILKNIEKKDIQNIINQINVIIDAGYAISDFIIGFNIYLRNCMIKKNDIKNEIILSDESVNWLKKSKFSTSDFLRMIDLSLQYESNLKFIKQPHISLETLFMKLSMMDSSIAISQLLNKKSINYLNINSEKPNQTQINEISEQSQIKESDKSCNVDSIEEKNDNISLKDVINSWDKIIKVLEVENSKTAHLLEEVTLAKLENNLLLIELVDGHMFHLKALEKDTIKIESAITTELNQKIKIKYHINKKVLDKSENKKTENVDHPLFTKVLETFEGEIIR